MEPGSWEGASVASCPRAFTERDAQALLRFSHHLGSSINIKLFSNTAPPQFTVPGLLRVNAWAEAGTQEIHPETVNPKPRHPGGEAP